MKKTILLSILWAAAAAFGFGQSENPPGSFGISFSGFIKTDIIHDSRQTMSLREGHFLLFPKDALPDLAGRDVNAAPSFNILSVQTRLAGKITGPNALGAKTSGLIEGEFFGTADGDTNGFRLRHAFIKLNWRKTEVLVGQFWHPMFITDCFPDVISFNTGVPFQPFSRAPQIRISRSFGKLSLAATVLSQRDFVSNGPEGASSVYLRNAAIPELNLKAQYAAKNEKAGTETLFGIGANVMSIVPRLVNAAGFKTGHTVSGSAVMAYVKHRRPKWIFKAEGVWGQNLHHLTMLGGYGIKDKPGPKEYEPIHVYSFWTELQTNGSPWQAGLFIGTTRNLGSRNTLIGPVYARGTDIRDIFRISPRLIFNSGKLRLAAEAELTSAAYGTPDTRDRVSRARTVSNFRLLLATYYFF